MIKVQNFACQNQFNQRILNVYGNYGLQPWISPFQRIDPQFSLRNNLQKRSFLKLVKGELLSCVPHYKPYLFTLCKNTEYYCLLQPGVGNYVLL